MGDVGPEVLAEVVDHLGPMAVVEPVPADGGLATRLVYLHRNRRHRERVADEADPHLVEAVLRSSASGESVRVDAGPSAGAEVVPVNGSCLVRFEAGGPPFPGAGGRRFHAGIDAMIDPLFILAAVRGESGAVVDLRYVHVNDAACRVYRMDRADIVGNTMITLFPMVEGTELFAGYARVVEKGEPLTAMVPFTGGNLDGWFELRGARFGDGVVISARDVTARVAAAASAARTNSVMDTLMGTATDPLAVLDSDGRVELCNRALSDRVMVPGAGDAELIGRRIDEVEGLDLAPRIRRLQEVAVKGGVPVTEVVSVPGHDAGGSWHELVVAPEIGPAGPTGRVVFSGRDVTVRRQWEDRLARDALRDPLTGLANRRLLLDRLGHDLDRLDREPGVVAALFLDLSGFKRINDTFGHAAGDATLKVVADRLRHATRHGDTVARVGGDEFVVVAPGLPDVDGALVLAERILRVGQLPVRLGASTHRLGVRVGVAVTGDASADPEALVRDADIAMLRARQRPGSHVEVFDTELRDALARRVEAEQSLRAGLANDEFVPWFQPEVNLVTGEIVGFEALVRRHRADGRIVAAGAFVEVAERSGLITALGEQVLGAVCGRVAEWRHGLGDRTPFVWVNLSGRELCEPGTAQRILDTIDGHGLDGSFLGFEITETAMLADLPVVIGNLERLKDGGFRFAVDDYGTGYAALTHLKQLAVHALKIDRSFVTDLPADRVDQAIVAGTVNLGHELGYRIIGEGVETEEQRAALVARGCTTGQGFLFSPAVPAEEVIDLVERQPFLERR